MSVCVCVREKTESGTSCLQERCMNVRENSEKIDSYTAVAINQALTL